MPPSDQFAFSFSGDDIEDTTEEDRAHVSLRIENNATILNAECSQETEVRIWDLRELLSALPDHLSYYTTAIRTADGGRRMQIPRRALFDVRVQIMAESNDCAPATAGGHRDGDRDRQDVGLGTSDIEQNVYEGGLKSWEGAVDLAGLLVERMETREEVTADVVVELGCGTALPSLVLFYRALGRLRREALGQEPPDPSLTFILADYNATVLQLVTVPNLLLTWAAYCGHTSLSQETGASPDYGHLEGELAITPELIASFLEDLARAGIVIGLISGPWSHELVQQIPIAVDPASILVLAAETIYSPASIGAFTDAMSDLLCKGSPGIGLVAAKRVYFGVGGGVDEFTRKAAGNGAEVTEVPLRRTRADEGVGRCVLELRLKR